MNMNMRNLTTLLFILCYTPIVRAQERLTLDDAITRTLKNNFDIQISDLALQQSIRSNTLGNAGFAPSIWFYTTVGGAQNNVRSDLANGGVQNNPNAQSTSLNPYLQINWTLFDGGRMFLVKKQLDQYVAISNAQLKQQIQTMVSRTIQTYARVVWLRQQVLAIDTGLSLAQTRIDISHLKYETGAGAKIDYLQARVDYNARRADSLNFVITLRQAEDSLSALMGEQLDKTYKTDDSLNLKLHLQAVDKQLLEAINPSLEALRRSATVSHLNADIARSAFLPTLNFNGGLNYARSTNSTGFSVFSRTYGLNGGLTLSMPLFEGGNIRRVARVATLQAMRDDLVYERQHTYLGKQYRSAWMNYNVSVAAYNLEKENIAFAKENLEVQHERFKVGIGTTLESREAENDYITALERLFTAAYTVKVNETLVLELQGELVH